MMMKEIALHVLDIVQNSITANATLVEVEVKVCHSTDKLTVSVKDNGKGMDETMAKNVISPFTTSRTTRKVGLGIPFFKAGAEATGGSFELESELGKGTYIAAEYVISNIDRPPLGDMAETMFTIVVCNPELDFVYRYSVDAAQYVFDTREIRSVLGTEVPLNMPDVAAWIRDDLEQGTEELNGGV